MRRHRASTLIGMCLGLVMAGCGDDWWLLGSESVEVKTYYGLEDPPAGGELTSCDAGESEPNGSLPQAVVITEEESCAGKIDGIVAGSDDVDYFRVDMDPGCGTSPSVKGVGGTRVCVFPVCREGATELGGCASGGPRFLDSGPIGCCGDDGVAQPEAFACSDPLGIAGSSMFIRVDLREPQAACVEYSIEFSN